MKKDKIIMSNMAFFGRHGVLVEENRLGQKFYVDVDLFLDTSHAGNTDDLTRSVSYADVYQLVKELVENREYKLLEALAENIAKDVLKQFLLIEGIRVHIKKPEAPVPGIFDYFGVEIFRGQYE